MSVTLAIEVSASPGSVAVGVDGEIQWQSAFATGPARGGELFGALAAAAAEAERFDEIRIGVGPGSYAGIRMALAAATGWSLASGARLFAVPSVCALDRDEPHWCVIGDARRGVFYFSAVVARRCVSGPRLADATEIAALLAAHDGWPVFASGPLPAFPESALAQATAARLLSVPASGAEWPLEPIYLREPYITQPRKVAGRT